MFWIARKDIPPVRKIIVQVIVQSKVRLYSAASPRTENQLVSKTLSAIGLVAEDFQQKRWKEVVDLLLKVSPVIHLVSHQVSECMVPRIAVNLWTNPLTLPPFTVKVKVRLQSRILIAQPLVRCVDINALKVVCSGRKLVIWMVKVWALTGLKNTVGLVALFDLLTDQ